MAINKTKLFAFLGLIGGAFLLFSSFAGSKTELPPGDKDPKDPNGDNSNPDQDEPWPDDPAITSNEDSTTYVIGSRFYATTIVPDPKYVKDHPNDRKVPLALQMRNITYLKKGWYGVIEITAPNQQVTANFFAANIGIADIYVSNGIQYLQTDYFIDRDNSQHMYNMIVLMKSYKVWSIDFKILAWEKPVVHIIVPGTALPILRMVQAYTTNPATGNRVIKVGYTFVVVRDQNYVLNNVKKGDLVKLDQTVNPEYNDKTVTVESVRERNPTTSERIIEIKFGYKGANTGGQVLLIN